MLTNCSTILLTIEPVSFCVFSLADKQAGKIKKRAVSQGERNLLNFINNFSNVNSEYEKIEVHLFHEMQEISINLPIIFQKLSLTEKLYWEEKMRLNIENSYAFIKLVKLVILFAGIV